ncbi:MAG TPA: cyanophycinase [Vicinamibacterales bacterium]|nr:cyanophycinase [Vicinamibacterales bacterium]
MAKKKAQRPQQRKRRIPSERLSHVPPLHAVPRNSKGSLLIIGGNETKQVTNPILEELTAHIGRGKLVIATFASNEPSPQWERYRRLFKKMGVRRIEHLDARSRDELMINPLEKITEGASAIFFGGGDQLKITSRFGGTPTCEAIRKLYAAGAMIAGTSSGASVMSETMLVAGDGDGSDNQSLRMAPGLGFIPGVIIDQHFAERGRIGRLLAAVAQNPRLLGLGIDEDTAVHFDGDDRFRVLGAGAVYVVDGRNGTYSNIAEDSVSASSMHGMIVHVLTTADTFDLTTRLPVAPPPKLKKAAVERAQESIAS